MRFISVTVRNYRVHKDFTAHFDPARNLIGGPNEAGKSTLVEAAHRALFLRAKTGGNVQKEMVSTRHLGDPEVLLVFDAANTRWELEKRFAGTKGSTRLTPSGGSSLRDDDAEAKLAELLKLETASGRAAANLLPSLWAHLWVWQGKAGDDPSTHATSHRAEIIRHLQQNGAAAVLQSTTDQRVGSRIADAYAELFTSTGRPKAGSKPEVARTILENAAAWLENARETYNRLAQAADEHHRAERDIAEIAAILPKLREERSITETKLQQVAALRRDEESQCQSYETAGSRRKELESHDRAIRDLVADLLQKSSALQPADEIQSGLAAAEESARANSQAANVRQKDVENSLRMARLHHDLANAVLASLEKQDIYDRIAKRTKDAAGVESELALFRSELAKLPNLTPKDLSRLQKLDAEVGQANAALKAMATGVELLEAQATVRIDGNTLAVGDSRILTATGEMVVGDGTRLRIHPGGGTSLAAARTRCETACNSLASALQSLTLHDLEHATAVMEQRQALSQKINNLENQWTLLGGDSLMTELALATSGRDSAREELKRRMDLAADAVTTPVPTDLISAQAFVSAARESLKSAEAAETASRAQASRLQEAFQAASEKLTHQRSEIAAARQEIFKIEAAIKAREDVHGNETQRTQALTAACEAETQAAARLQVTRDALTALRPDLLQADLDRFNRAVNQQENRLRESENSRLVARDRLTLDGSCDPETDLRLAEARHRTASDDYHSELRRAKAIEILHQLFCSSREAMDRAVIQPLADRITGYLTCIFGPGTEARVQLSGAGIDGLELVRPGSSAFSFASLSGGAKEQTAAAVRLALAEILANDHDGCLPIVFDDAFAYSDPERIQSLQRMLDLAATRGLQVIVLTCTPGDYVSFGADEIRIATT